MIVFTQTIGAKTKGSVRQNMDANHERTKQLPADSECDFDEDTKQRNFGKMGIARVDKQKRKLLTYWCCGAIGLTELLRALCLMISSLSPAAVRARSSQRLHRLLLPLQVAPRACLARFLHGHLVLV